jgi:hypothetical protein
MNMPQITIEVSNRALEMYKEAFEREMARNGIKGEVTDVVAMLQDNLTMDLDEPHVLVKRHLMSDDLTGIAGLTVS